MVKNKQVRGNYNLKICAKSRIERSSAQHTKPHLPWEYFLVLNSNCEIDMSFGGFKGPGKCMSKHRLTQGETDEPAPSLREDPEGAPVG